MPKQFIADLKDRDVVDSPFMVKEKTMAMAKNGKPYMNLKFRTRAARLTASCGTTWMSWTRPFRRVILSGFAAPPRSTWANATGGQRDQRLEEEGVDLGFCAGLTVPQAEMRASWHRCVHRCPTPI